MLSYVNCVQTIWRASAVDMQEHVWQFVVDSPLMGVIPSQWGVGALGSFHYLLSTWSASQHMWQGTHFWWGEELQSVFGCQARYTWLRAWLPVLGIIWFGEYSKRQAWTFPNVYTLGTIFFLNLYWNYFFFSLMVNS